MKNGRNVVKANSFLAFIDAQRGQGVTNAQKTHSLFQDERGLNRAGFSGQISCLGAFDSG